MSASPVDRGGSSSQRPVAPGGRRRLSGRIDLGRDGRRIDLLVDGIAYSTWHPEQPWSGYVWDALAATGLLTASRTPSVLLLGGGGGTALLLLRRLLPEARLTAVELDERVIAVARERFGLDALGVETIVGDGNDVLARMRRRFDLVLDDMYAPGPQGLRRPVADEVSHLRRIASRLEPGGIAATNSTTDDDPPGLQRTLRAAYREVFPHRLELAPRRGWNVVVAGSRSPLPADAVRRPRGPLAADDRAGVTAVRVRRA